MKKLLKPDFKVKDVVTDCIESYRSQELVNRFKMDKDQLNSESESYNDCAINNSWNTIQKHKTPNHLNKKEMIDLYDKKFVKHQLPRTKYYDKILSKAYFNLCPICGVGYASTLDHYLPKSVYPMYTVTPYNLIPQCKDCNKDKGATDFSSGLAPLNPYYDDVENDIWLQVELEIKNNNLIPLYAIVNDKPIGWSDELFERAKNHFVVYKNLGTIFSLNATSEIENCKYAWKEIYVVSGKESLKQEYKEKLLSFQKFDLNSWKSALYRSLVENTDLVCTYLDGVNI